jgi:hypothetical protein
MRALIRFASDGNLVRAGVGSPDDLSGIIQTALADPCPLIPATRPSPTPATATKGVPEQLGAFPLAIEPAYGLTRYCETQGNTDWSTEAY